MLNPTDPTLAPLVARYRAWVEAENQHINQQNQVAYEKNRASYNNTSWLLRLIAFMPLEPPIYDTQPTYQGFLDWAIREGIEAPKGNL